VVTTPGLIGVLVLGVVGPGSGVVTPTPGVPPGCAPGETPTPVPGVTPGWLPGATPGCVPNCDPGTVPGCVPGVVNVPTPVPGAPG
jgi:hypothetical protein